MKVEMFESARLKGAAEEASLKNKRLRDLLLPPLKRKAREDATAAFEKHAHRIKAPRGKPMNARLEWRGRKLMCNGVCVARISPPNLHREGEQWMGMLGSYVGFVHRSTEAACRRAVSRRFKIEER